MSTTSNFPADFRGFCASLLLIPTLGCASAAQPTARNIAPEAPRAARPATASAPERGHRIEARPVELRSVGVRRISREEAAKRNGAKFAETARAPLAIEVKTQAPLGRLDRTSSPVIVLNGTVLSDTIALDAGTLLALLPDDEKLRERNTLEVVWLGDEERTRTRTPLTFGPADIR